LTRHDDHESWCIQHSVKRANHPIGKAGTRTPPTTRLVTSRSSVSVPRMEDEANTMRQPAYACAREAGSAYPGEPGGFKSYCKLRDSGQGGEWPCKCVPHPHYQCFYSTVDLPPSKMPAGIATATAVLLLCGHAVPSCQAAHRQDAPRSPTHPPTC